MNQNTNIRFPSFDGGPKAYGPYDAGRVYAVPADIAKHLQEAGAEVATLAPATKDKPAETVTPLDARHHEGFAHIRAIVKQRADDKAKEAKPVESAAPAIVETAAKAG